ncbi:unnamed protein product [Rangifer tarandus platyrhynchus]|uniref:Uncharacterized protein n=1 Tax=Rangifer tarandus platyrhynchus TaxID=3082113 RepID=A0AC59ZMP6_RANTA
MYDGGPSPVIYGQGPADAPASGRLCDLRPPPRLQLAMWSMLRLGGSVCNRGKATASSSLDGPGREAGPQSSRQASRSWGLPPTEVHRGRACQALAHVTLRTPFPRTRPQPASPLTDGAFVDAPVTA